MQTRSSARKATTTAAEGETSSLLLYPSATIAQPKKPLPITLLSTNRPRPLGTVSVTAIRENVQADNTDSPSPITTKRKSTYKTTPVLIRGGWDVLPHNLGPCWVPNGGTDAECVAGGEASVTKSGQGTLKTTASETLAVTSKSYSLRSRKTVLPLNNGVTVPFAIESITDPGMTDQAAESHIHNVHDTNEPARKRQRRAQQVSFKAKNKMSDPRSDADSEHEPSNPRKMARKTKDNPYGLTPGETPYPDWRSPTAEQCEEVYQILADMHDDVQPLPPVTIPAPSLEVAGCGEVPCVLDGLIRTVLSGSTTFDTADKMLQALVRRFGVMNEGIGKGSVNWNDVRTAEYEDVYQQLKLGGLGAIKAKNIQAILQMVYEENVERRDTYLREKETGILLDDVGASEKTNGQKNLEILRAEQDTLSLDHMHSMTKDQALRHFVRYPGVGIKTAACVTLFSLQRPCFAVDTHVFRLSRWLGWVPQKSNEDNTFSHLEVRCPDKLKYGLHQLFIRHGKTCYKCNDKSYMGTTAWNEAECPLEELVNRFSKRVAKAKEDKERRRENKGKLHDNHRDIEKDDIARAENNSDETVNEGLMTGNNDLDECEEEAQVDEDSSDSELSELDEEDMDVDSFKG